MLKQRFGERIRFLRTVANLSQRQLAEKIGVSEVYVGKMERGKSSPSFDVIDRLCQALDTTPAIVFLFDEFEASPNAAATSASENSLPPTAAEGSKAKASVPPRIDCAKYITHTGVWEKGADGKESMSDSLCKLFGYRPNDVRPSLNFMMNCAHKDDRELIRQAVAQSAENGGETSFTFRFFRKQGTMRVAMAFVEGGNGAARIQVIDITEMKKMGLHMAQNQQTLEEHIRERTSSLHETIFKLGEEIQQRTKVELNLELDRKRFEALYELGRLKGKTEQEIKDHALEKSLEVTQSEIGYIYLMDDKEEELHLHAWSRGVLDACTVAGRPSVYKVCDTGLWGEAVRRRSPVVTNDYKNSPLARGVPEGHVPVKRHMNLPVFDDGKIVLLCGVGNKKAAYDESDVQQLQLLMDGVWSVIKQQRADKALRASDENYKQLFNFSPVSLREENYATVVREIDLLKGRGVANVAVYLEDHPGEVKRLADMIDLKAVNQSTLDLYKVRDIDEFKRLRAELYRGPGDYLLAFRAIAEGEPSFMQTRQHRDASGQVIDVQLKWTVIPGHEQDYAKVLVSALSLGQYCSA